MSPAHQVPRAILFDLDGTLVDTAPDLACATNALRAHHGLAPLAYEEIRGQVSNGGSALVTLATGLECDTQAHDTARQYLLDAYEQAVAVRSHIFKPLDAWLARWQAEERLWGIVTNKPRRYTLPLLDALGLTPGTLFCADDLSVKKPAPEPLLAAAQQLGVPPQSCWYVGDHLRDIEAANAAGMTAIAVGYGYLSDEDDYQRWPADIWFKTCEELVSALNAFHLSPESDV